MCLLSGGMDSFVSAAIAREEGRRIYALSLDYGQKNRRELRSAGRIARFLEAAAHKILRIDLSWTHSALTDRALAIPRTVLSGIPATYVPARNTVFLSLALSYAESVNADAVFLGVNAIDYSGYPDCRPEYVRRFQKLVDVATKKTVEGGTIRIVAPLVRMAKADIVKRGVALGLDFALSWSCYHGGKQPCRHCASCILRARGFKGAGLADPLLQHS